MQTHTEALRVGVQQSGMYGEDNMKKIANFAILSMLKDPIV